MRAAPERRLHRGGQALGHPHRQQDVVRETHRAGATRAPLPRDVGPQHLLRIQVRVTRDANCVGSREGQRADR